MKNISDVTTQPDFLQLSYTTLLSLLNSERINCEEVSLIDACSRWAQHQVYLERDIAPEAEIPAEAVQQKMLPLLPHLRFLKLTAVELVALLKLNKFMSDGLSYKLLSHLVSPNDIAAPEEVSQVTDKRENYTLTEVFVCGINNSFIQDRKNLRKITSKPQQFLTQFFQSNIQLKFQCKGSYNTYVAREHLLPCVLKSCNNVRATVPTQQDRNKEPSEQYEEHFTIALCGNSPDDVLYHSVTQQVAYNSEVTVDIDIQDKLPFGSFKTFVFYHVPGVYPVGKFVTTVVD